MPLQPYRVSRTCAGMTVWSAVFASLGSAARNLLTSGVDFSAALSAVSEDAGEITEKVLAVALALGVMVLVFSQLPSPCPDPEDEQEAQSRSPLPPKTKVEISAGDEY